MGKNSKILILGNRGFLGASLFAHLSQQGESEVIGYNSSSLDLTCPDNYNSLESLVDRDTTVIMAARAASDPDPLKTFNRDLAIICNVVQFFEKKPVKKFIYLSSISVYGEDETNLSISEETKIAPSSYYGISKFTSEELLRKAAKESETPLVVLRPCMVYGPGHVGLPYGPDRMVNSLFNKNLVEIFGDGCDRRDYLFIKDFLVVMKKFITDDCFGTYNLGTGNNYSPWDIIGVLRGLMENEFQIIKLKRMRPKINQKLDTSKLRGFLKDYAFTSIGNGLKQSFEALQNHSSSESLKMAIPRASF